MARKKKENNATIHQRYEREYRVVGGGTEGAEIGVQQVLRGVRPLAHQSTN